MARILDPGDPAVLAAETARLINLTKDFAPNAVPVIKCTVCGKAMRKERALCGACTKAVLLDAGGKPRKQRVMSKRTQKQLAKARAKAAKRGAYKAATGGIYKGTDKGAALNAMWRAALDSPDPAERLAAEKFLSK